MAVFHIKTVKISMVKVTEEFIDTSGQHRKAQKPGKIQSISHQTRSGKPMPVIHPFEYEFVDQAFAETFKTQHAVWSGTYCDGCVSDIDRKLWDYWV
jgi:hypothetical protein